MKKLLSMSILFLATTTMGFGMDGQSPDDSDGLKASASHLPQAPMSSIHSEVKSLLTQHQKTLAGLQARIKSKEELDISAEDFSTLKADMEAFNISPELEKAHDVAYGTSGRLKSWLDALTDPRTSLLGHLQQYPGLHSEDALGTLSNLVSHVQTMSQETDAFLGAFHTLRDECKAAKEAIFGKKQPSANAARLSFFDFLVLSALLGHSSNVKISVVSGDDLNELFGRAAQRAGQQTASQEGDPTPSSSSPQQSFSNSSTTHESKAGGDDSDREEVD